MDNNGAGQLVSHAMKDGIYITVLPDNTIGITSTQGGDHLKFWGPVLIFYAAEIIAKLSGDDKPLWVN